MTTFRNLTPHRLRVLARDGRVLLELVPDTPAARIVQEAVSEVVDGGVPVRAIRYGETVGLPEMVDGVLLVVARVVAQQVPRADLVFPDQEVRDADGQIIGCRALARFA